MSPRPTPPTVVLVTVLAAATMTAAQSAGPPVIAITHVSIVDVEHGRLLPDRTVLVRGDRIETVVAASRAVVPLGARVVNGSGKFLIPGLWDMHVHLNERALPILLRYGITGVRDMGGDDYKRFLNFLRKHDCQLPFKEFR